MQQSGYAAVLALTQRGGRRVFVAENGEAVPVQAGGPMLLTKAKRLQPEDAGEIQTLCPAFSPTPFSVRQVIAQASTKGTTLRQVFDGVI
ncbi:MAG: hypothetical protein R3C68_06970 [Myxococcota bacterium]